MGCTRVHLIHFGPIQGGKGGNAYWIGPSCYWWLLFGIYYEIEDGSDDIRYFLMEVHG
jgi:hypothetical protein